MRSSDSEIPPSKTAVGHSMKGVSKSAGVNVESASFWLPNLEKLQHLNRQHHLGQPHPFALLLRMYPNVPQTTPLNCANTDLDSQYLFLLEVREAEDLW